MSSKPVPANTVPFRSRPLRSSCRTALLVIGIAGCGGFLSRVAARPAKHRETSHHHKPVASEPRPSNKRKIPDYWNMSLNAIQLWDRTVSNDLLNQTDHPELRTYAALSVMIVPDVSVMFPDVGAILVSEPTLMGLSGVHPAPRDPWNGYKNAEQYSLDAEERLSNSRYNWQQYQAAFRTIAGWMGSDNTPYPSQPSLQYEARVEFGNWHAISPGQYVYSPDWPGNVAVQNASMGRDGFYTPYVMQRALIANWATDRMAQAFLSPLYFQSPACGMKQFKRDLGFKKASDQANRDAGPYDRLALSGSTSQSRGENARLAAKVYHASLHRMYHEMQLE